MKKHLPQLALNLAERLARKPCKKTASGFSSPEMAESAIRRTLAANEALIDNWLKNSDLHKKAVSRSFGTEKIGVVARRGKQPALVSGSTVTLVLVRDEAAPKERCFVLASIIGG